MYKYTKIPLDTFNNMELNAGILLTDFDPANPADDDTLYKNMIGATSGGTTISATPSFIDLGEDVDNCPKNTKELKKLDGWECKASGTFVTISRGSLKLQLAAADADEDTGKITIRNYLKDSDFADLWWVGDYNQGDGLLAVRLINALSTSGLTIKSSDKAKGTADFEFTGHYSIKDQDTVPLVPYVIETESSDDATDEDTTGDDDAATASIATASVADAGASTSTKKASAKKAVATEEA